VIADAVQVVGADGVMLERRASSELRALGPSLAGRAESGRTSSGYHVTIQGSSLGCLIFIGHVWQKSPVISGSFAKMTCNLRHPMSLGHLVSQNYYLYLMHPRHSRALLLTERLRSNR